MIIQFDNSRREKKADCLLMEAIYGQRYSTTPVLKNYRSPYDKETQEKLKVIIDKLLNNLTKKEKMVITELFGFYGRRKTYEELAKTMKSTEEDVKAIETLALRKLRQATRSSGLMEIMFGRYKKDIGSLPMGKLINLNNFRNT